jgi:hypothetical protein
LLLVVVCDWWLFVVVDANCIPRWHNDCWATYKSIFMPKQTTIDAAKRDKAQGKSASTQAGEFVKEEMDKVRSGKTSVRNNKQAIAIGLSEARRSGVDLKAPPAGKTSGKTRKSAESASPKKAARAKGPSVRSAAAKKAAKTRGQS